MFMKVIMAVIGFACMSYALVGQAFTVEGGSDIGVFSFSSTSLGVYGVSTSGAGILGQSGSHWGLYGFSGSSVGVVEYGQTYDFDAIGPGINYGAASSIRWKSNIQNISQPLDKLGRLRGVYFDWDKEHGGMHDIGFIAEEVGKVLPEIVAYEDNGMDATGLDYSKLTPLLVEAVNAMRKEYQKKFAEQADLINELQKEVSALECTIASRR